MLDKILDSLAQTVLHAPNHILLNLPLHVLGPREYMDNVNIIRAIPNCPTKASCAIPQRYLPQHILILFWRVNVWLYGRVLAN